MVRNVTTCRDLLERLFTVTALNECDNLVVETSDSGIRCGVSHVCCRPVEGLSYESQNISTLKYNVVLAIRRMLICLKVTIYNWSAKSVM